MIRKERLPLPTSIIATLVAYGILTYVPLREKPDVVRTDFIEELLAFLPHAIAFVNALAVVLLAAGWWLMLIRNGYVKLHRIAMPSALGLICLFLIMYVTRVYLGGIKEFPGPET